ncbi:MULTISPECIES: low molecular weight protein-tyrosine-phosphatase [Streptomyces]|uniref:low molecular weight protein-tyrosine-phosphatase n=1 Tax=Streptomyces TaxID=1883 RepID=UPI000AAEAE8B|nr:low molecular weight protein-tyrosine-phosphatase [Streptomyces durhamensis]
MRKVLTVCLGNYCRSPFAAVALARRGAAELEIRSAGLIGKWEGEPANESMITAARRLGLDLTAHRGQQITLNMLNWADSVLAMDATVLETLRAICGEANEHKLGLYLGDRDVPDPMGKDQEAFNACAVLIETGTALHLGQQ